MRLIIFGDSFAHPHKADYVWTNNIGEKLKVDGIINYSNNGASIEYCLHKLDYYIKNDYSNNDKIIFFITNPTRVPLVDNDYVPDWGSLSSAYDIVKGESRLDRTAEHVKEHSAYYKTHVVFTTHEHSEYKFYTALSALNTISNDTLVLFSFNKPHKNILKLNWRNNLIISSTIAYEIAGNEIKGNIESINDLTFFHFIKSVRYFISVFNLLGFDAAIFLSDKFNCVLLCSSVDGSTLLYLP